MELNRERIVRGLACCKGSYDCFTCDIYKRGCAGFREGLARDALALINELTEENERLRDFTKEQFKSAWTVREDTVRKMQERFENKFDEIEHFYFEEEHENFVSANKVLDLIDQIAKEMLEGKE